MSISRQLYLQSIIEGHVPKRPSLFFPKEISQKDIDEMRNRKACINCTHFKLGNGNYLLGDGSCKHGGPTYGIVESLERTKCEYFDRRE
jgi:hypothetical protein